MAEPTTSPSVSVIIPAYNPGADLDTCLAAIGSSDWPVKECIVVDDGSSDGSVLEFARKHGASYHRLESRSGPAVARNTGAAQACSDILFFVDADVELHPDAIGGAARTLEADPSCAAVFGSYDDSPGHPSFLSRYRNLYHHWTHQTAKSEASTFWSGIGAIRRDIFEESGGFSPLYTQPSIEDIELGYRFNAAGHRIRLVKNLLGKHLKQWRLVPMLRTDLWQRGVPWVVLTLRFPQAPADLNIDLRSRVATGLVTLLALSVLALGLGYGSPLLPLVLMLAVAWNQRGFLQLASQRYGIGFALATVPMLLLLFFVCALAVPLGYLRNMRVSD